MATAAPSPLASSVEKTNGNKLSRLLIDGGTTVLRNVFDSYHPPKTLSVNLYANYSILSKLRRKKILNGSQWEKLFPPGGGHPSSKNFDITLLFLLLSNICGLYPPPSGPWHKMPPASDTSREANLTRVKFYRNELYGHLATTGIPTPEFIVKWQEVSSVLVSLGLNQSEVDRLRREPCGEDYVSAVTEWMKNDDEIKFQLKDVIRKQQQVLQTQQEDQRTLNDTHQIVEKVRHTQVEASKTLHDTHQTVSKVEKTQLEAIKLQQEDHRTLQDTHQAVGSLQEMQKEAMKLQQEDHRTLQDTQQVIQGVQKSVQDAKEMLEDFRRTQRESRQQVTYDAVNAEDRRDKVEEDETLQKLAKVNTEKIIQYHSGKYQEGTRLHIFEKIKLWIDDLTSENRVMVISGDAGMGKSVIAAVVCQIMQHSGRLLGSHFCQHNKERYRNPKVMLQSLACQLCDVLPEYKSELLKKLSRNLGVDMNSLEVQELFEFLFEEPLCSVGDPGRSLLLVIDGLDESEYKGRNELIDVIANHFCTLPAWVRFCVTARPEVNIAGRLKKFNPVQLKQDDEENVKDIRLFLERQLSNVIQSSFAEVVISELARKAAGHILYAYLMADFINKNFSSFTPEDLGRTYGSPHKSRKPAAKQPLPLDFVSKMLRSDAKSPACHRKVRKAIECISTLLPVQDGCIHFFHKSVKDWLTDRTAYGQHSFSVDEKQGQLALSELCTGELNDVKRKGVHGAEFSDPARYALQHGVDHLLELEESTRASSFKKIVKNYVIDFEIVFAKLCVNNTTSSEDIIRVQRHELFRALSRRSKRTLSTMLFLLRKYHERLTAIPSTFFQVMMKEGGKDCAKKAKELLHAQYHDIPFMKFVDKRAAKEQISGIQAVFRCTSQVACFDISPQQEFMVCECRNGMIQLWSLQTGKLIWKRPVTVEKRYFEDYGAFRMVPNTSILSCYRSVVFHPTKLIVLPGVLSHAYSSDGDFLPLFPRSNCRFSVCSINRDTMITDSLVDARCLIMWNLQNGDEISQTVRNEVVLSFAWSSNGGPLAISHSSGLICLVDALNCFETLAEVNTFEPCGMIKFTPDLKFLFGWLLPVESMSSFRKVIRFHVFKLPWGTFSFFDVDGNVGSEPWDYQSPSKGAFLMGDPISNSQDGSIPRPSDAFVFVLNKQCLVRAYPGSNNIEICSQVALKVIRQYGLNFVHIAFALDGKTIYGVTADGVIRLDVSNRKIKENNLFRATNLMLELPSLDDDCVVEDKLPYLSLVDNCVVEGSGICLVPVSKGVLLKRRDPWAAVQLWNFKLSKEVRSWSSLREVTYIFPVTDQCVACVGRGFEVSILDTSSEEIVNTIILCHEEYQSTYPVLCKEAIECNSKYQLLSTAFDSVQLSDGKSILWKRAWKNSLLRGNIAGMFTPSEEFVLVSAGTSQSRQEVHVLDASSGNTLRTLCSVDDVSNCAFVSNEECVIDRRDFSRGYHLLLFNVRTGDLLSVLDVYATERPKYMAAFPQKGLIAMGLRNSKRMHPFIEVKVPRDKVSRKAKVSESSRTTDEDCDAVRKPL
ncbi:unnamed protein product [Porites evermanni]|uniref:NACHT domain-containing protein n=1 Tax=Porites evermanni TaxID=104178 RepID=A0ABN8LJJ9_9CNID|nr:unnamed protein product [Porites evermanni]